MNEIVIELFLALFLETKNNNVYLREK